MSTATTPISPARFAEALKDLPLSTLHLKAAELRNSIAHLDYSNEQLKPFAEGTEPSQTTPDQDCIDALHENTIVIARMQQRIELLKAEVEGRGQSWTEFRSEVELTAEGENKEEDERLVNGTAEEQNRRVGEERSSPWTDGTFQMGRIVNGEVRIDGAERATGSRSDESGIANANGNSVSAASASNGGRLDDDTLRRVIEERMRNLGQEDDEEEGMHL